MHSALKRDGRPLYELARQGVVVDRAARRVTIFAIDVLRFAAPLLELRIRCSKGTYIRSLAMDLGERLGCGAHLRALRRERVGALDVADAVTLEALEALSLEARRARLLAPDALLASLPRIDLDAESAVRFVQGQRLRLRQPSPDGRVRVYAAGRLLGVGRRESDALLPHRLVSTAAPDTDEKGR